jgi:hypothetical protein
MEIDALEQLISEDVKVQGQISCVMVLKLASWSSESSPELLRTMCGSRTGGWSLPCVMSD